MGRLSEDCSDAEALEAVANGSRSALNVLYRRHAPWLAARLARRCAEPEVVSDVVQDTFVAVWRGAGRYGARGEVAAWIWGIAVRRLIAQFRRRPLVRPAWDEGRSEEGSPSAEELVLSGVQHGDLAGALNRLSPELRAVVQATVLDGLTTREAARLLGIPAGTVKTRLRRARMELRGDLT